MSKKLGRSELPSNHTREDFEAFGPVATKDTQFSGCKLADMGCFKQDESVDSNKFYHVAVVKSKKTSEWWLYVEYGRTTGGVADRPQFQFTLCESEQEAMSAFEKQCAEKNTKRGIWEKLGSKDRFVPKPKKGKDETEDLYVVRYMVSRGVGLPSAKNICNQSELVAEQTVNPKTSSKRKIDLQTKKLFQDLLGGTKVYAKSSMTGGTLPALSAISEARDLLQDAIQRVGIVGNNLQSQIADSELKKLTYTLYGMIPKAKPQGASEDAWILSQDNIVNWQHDLDAFESALKTTSVQDVDDDVMNGIPADVEYVDLSSELGKFLTNWWSKATKNRHGHSTLKIHHLWKIKRHEDDVLFNKHLNKTLDQMPSKWNEERPLFVDLQKERPDLSASERKKLWKANVFLGFHGTRAVNSAGIIREGFRFPAELKKIGVAINGAMFGPGVYQADDWGKSAGYCSRPSGSSYYVNDGHVPGRKSFMFACDVILGVPHIASGSHGYTEPPTGCHSVFGKAGFTSSWGGKLVNNEWIIYKKGQSVIRYLAELSWY